MMWLLYTCLAVQITLLFVYFHLRRAEKYAVHVLEHSMSIARKLEWNTNQIFATYPEVATQLVYYAINRADAPECPPEHEYDRLYIESYELASQHRAMLGWAKASFWKKVFTAPKVA